MLSADIQRHVGRLAKGLQQRCHLAGTAGAEFHQRAAAEGRGDGGGLPLKQAGFGGGECVFRLLADQVKQAGAFGVVEKPSRQLFGGAAEALDHQLAHVCRGGMQIEQLHRPCHPGCGATPHRCTSRTSLTPLAIQRLAGG